MVIFLADRKGSAAFNLDPGTLRLAWTVHHWGLLSVYISLVMCDTMRGGGLDAPRCAVLYEAVSPQIGVNPRYFSRSLSTSSLPRTMKGPSRSTWSRLAIEPFR